MLTPFQVNREGWKEAQKNEGVYKITALSGANEAERAPHVNVKDWKLKRFSSIPYYPVVHIFAIPPTVSWPCLACHVVLKKVQLNQYIISSSSTNPWNFGQTGGTTFGEFTGNVSSLKSAEQITHQVWKDESRLHSSLCLLWERVQAASPKAAQDTLSGLLNELGCK